MENVDSMFGYMFIGIGFICLYSAYRGKGMAYNNQYPAHIKEEANKLLRVFLWIFGPILLVQGYLDTQGITAEHGFIYPIFLGIVSAVFVAYYIIFRKKFGKALKKDKKKEINKPL